MITVEKIQCEHLAALSELYEELMGQHSHPDRLHDVYRMIERDPNYYLLGAYEDNQLLGSLMGIVCYDLVEACNPFMVIENVIVSSRAQRKGVGQKLITQIEQIARDRECSYIILVSGGQRKEAHLFYERMGYREEEVEGFRKHL